MANHVPLRTANKSYGDIVVRNEAAGGKIGRIFSDQISPAELPKLMPRKRSCSGPPTSMKPFATASLINRQPPVLMRCPSCALVFSEELMASNSQGHVCLLHLIYIIK